MEKRVWDEFVTELDQQVFDAAGYGKQMGYGTRPALFIIDVHYNFVGDQPEPILESVKKYRTSCGEQGWVAVGHIKKLLDAVRSKNFPVVYTVSERRKDYFDSGVQRLKSYRHMEPTSVKGTKGTQVVAEVAPEEIDILISKRKPSAFFGTPLMSFMNDLDVDTIIITGTTTSGCIRATAVDAFAYNFKTIIPEECCFDRFWSSHAINLFDLNTKYADVVPLEEVLNYVNNLSERKDGKWGGIS
jgi:nicotinamidase-related amidase